MKDKILFLILGATGDLTKKKIIPAIYNLVEKKQIKNFAIVGAARRDIKPGIILNEAKKFIKKPDKKIWDKISKRFYYDMLDFYNKEDYVNMHGSIGKIMRKHKLTNKLVYLATLPSHFEAIASNMSRHCPITKGKGWCRLVFEKPFGNDLKSAKKINKAISKIFRENQIYRMDHYLGKELISNIAVSRFTNTFLEPIWNNQYVDHVQIILSEDIGTEGRAGYYDKYGALKDVVQNHMMQMLCLTAMEQPKLLTEKHIRDEKVKVLKAVKKVDNVVLGQYAGYKKEKGVKASSRTETFAAMKLSIDNKRWKNVPFYMITGKKMKLRLASIYIQFKHSPCLLFEGICNFNPNYIVIQVQPDAGIYMQLNAKYPGKQDIVPVHLDFCHSCTFGTNTPVAYENLMLDILDGDQSAFIRSDEIEEAWKLVDKISKKKKAGKIKVQSYKTGAMPDKAKDIVKWHLRKR